MQNKKDSRISLVSSVIFVIRYFSVKVEKIEENSLDSIPLPSLSVKIQIIGRKVYLLGDVNKLFVFKSLLTTPSNVLRYYLKQTFGLIIEFSLKVKVLRSNLCYLLKPFLLYWVDQFAPSWKNCFIIRCHFLLFIIILLLTCGILSKLTNWESPPFQFWKYSLNVRE